ncbi:hypothetical protein CSOJ01_10446 [Colletotrichum sojae]|uniref:Uncharacterized protein n=1 Tax=Colletotrichum sojae TaxID=2175907 RepID=A0A8H6J0G7_9PEZI|nr:hypothetical protein CSOJ01_10446 [Colletotrichum sojae]
MPGHPNKEQRTPPIGDEERQPFGPCTRRCTRLPPRRQCLMPLSQSNASTIVTDGRQVFAGSVVLGGGTELAHLQSAPGEQRLPRSATLPASGLGFHGLPSDTTPKSFGKVHSLEGNLGKGRKKNHSLVVAMPENSLSRRMFLVLPPPSLASLAPLRLATPALVPSRIAQLASPEFQTSV